MSANGHFDVAPAQDPSGKWFVGVRPLGAAYFYLEMTCTEAATYARELNACADKVRRLNNPPRAFYDRRA
jgi:hypothetical protein